MILIKKGGETGIYRSEAMEMLRVIWRLAPRLYRATIIACVLTFGISQPGIAAPNVQELRIGANETGASTQSSLRTILESADSRAESSVRDQLLSFYQARDFKPVWTGSDEASARAQSVRSALEDADAQGLKAEDYTSALSRWNEAPDAGQKAAEYDLAMTAALFRYASDVRNGRFDPGKVYKDVRLPPHKFDVSADLSQALKQDDIETFLAELPPPQKEYRELVDALAQYRAIEEAGGWPIIPGKSPLSLAGKDKRIAALTKRLAIEDPALAAIPEPTVSDLRMAVLRFQRHTGLDDNGQISAETLQVLNTPASYRVKQILANMERWRWMPRTFEKRYVMVNVPDESLDFIRDGSIVLHSRVVVGRKDNPTPILRTAAVAVIANPPWNIPDDIAAKNILPQLRRSPDYLASRNMVLADGPADDPYGININWQDVHAGDIPYQIQENPGPDNALGALMLDMPNDFNVYLHDTPNKKLFVSNMREISHGCVRVEEIFPLASLALTNSKDDGDSLAEAVSSGETQRMQLPDPLAVYLVYWTAIAEPDGTVEFRPDRYGRDRALIAKLSAKG